MDTTSNDCLFFTRCHDDSRHLLSHHVQRFQWIKESRTKLTNGETCSSNDVFSISINSLVNVDKLHVKRRLERKAKNTINSDYIQLYASHTGIEKGERNTPNYYVSKIKVKVMVFNVTFNNISVIWLRLFLFVEETRVPRENHRPVTSHWQTLSCSVVWSSPRLSGIPTHNVISSLNDLHSVCFTVFAFMFCLLIILILESKISIKGDKTKTKTK